MHEYLVYREWRGITLWGESLADAITRAGVLRRPDTYEAGMLVERGEECRVARVVGEVDVTSTTRDGAPILRVLVELDDHRLVTVDARETGAVVR